MPTTISSLFVFVAILTPGFVYLTRTETRLPGRRYSALRETASIVSVSVATNAVVLVGFWIVRSVLSGITPDVGALLRDPQTYLANHPAQVTMWFAGLLGAAVGLGALAAVPPEWSEKLFSRVGRWPGPTIAEYIENRRARGPIAPESGWGVAFHEKPDRMVYVGLRLRDETYLDGPLLSFSSQIEENDQRSIKLGRPVRISFPSATEAELLPWDVDAVIVSASEIKMISVNYLPKGFIKRVDG